MKRSRQRRLARLKRMIEMGPDAGYRPGGDGSDFMSYGQRISWSQYLVMLLMAAAFWGLYRLFR